MSAMISTAAPYEIKTSAAVLAEDVICQSFIQSSSTLAYACLLIRRGRHDLATHVLHSLEDRPASRFRDMVYYLQCQIGIEVGEFSAVKKRLVPRVHQLPNDMVALSLLESCIFQEYEDWQRRNPHLAAEEGVARTRAEERAVMAAPEAPSSEYHEADPGDPIASPPEPSLEPVPEFHTLQIPQVPNVAAAFEIPDFPAPRSEGAESYQTIPSAAAQPVAVVEAPRPAPSPTDPAAGAPFASSATGEQDLGIYQTLASDVNTQALCLWNAQQRRLRSLCRNPALEPLVATLPQALPHDLEDAVRALDAGDIHKVCLSFTNLTLTSLHAGPENLGLVTGNINQSLITMVRAENIFLKQGAVRGSARGPAAEARP